MHPKLFKFSNIFKESLKDDGSLFPIVTCEGFFYYYFVHW